MSNDPLVVSLKRSQKSEPMPPPPPLPPPPVREPRRERPRPGGLMRRILILLFLAFLAVTGWYAYDRTSLFSGGTPSGDAELTQQEVTDLIESVGRLIDLPEGEEPTVATVSDPEKLKDQPFFANAKVGDKVLLYTKARKAYLYDPVRHKLVEVAPITTEIQP